MRIPQKKLFLTMASIFVLSGMVAASEIPNDLYYNFEDIEDSVVQDKSETGGNDGDLSSGARSTTNSYYGDYAVEIDQGSYVDIQDQSDNLYQDSGFTFMTWYNPSSTGDTGLVMLGACCEPRHGYTIQQDDGQLRFWGSEETANDNNNVRGGNAVTKWTHVAVTVTNSGSLYIYQDGDQVGSGNLPVPTSPNDAGDDLRSTPKLALGGENVDGGEGAGVVLDEVRVYDNYMTQTEIQEAMNQPVEVDSGINICDRRGSLNECISNTSHSVSGQFFNISSVFESQDSSFFSALSGMATLKVENSTSLSGVWEGSFNISTTGNQRSVVEPGADFRPENGRIVIG